MALGTSAVSIYDSETQFVSFVPPCRFFYATWLNLFHRFFLIKKQSDTECINHSFSYSSSSMIDYSSSSSCSALWLYPNREALCLSFVGAASKRFGIDGDREAVPLMLEVVYNTVRWCSAAVRHSRNILTCQLHNESSWSLPDAFLMYLSLSLLLFLSQVVISGRSQWTKKDKVCTSINLTKACKNPEELGDITTAIK